MKPPKSYLYDYNRTTAPPWYFQYCADAINPPKPKVKRKYRPNEVKKKRSIREYEAGL